MDEEYANPVNEKITKSSDAAFETEASEERPSSKKKRFQNNIKGNLKGGLDAMKDGVENMTQAAEKMGNAAHLTNVKDLMKFADLAVFGSMAEADENEFREQEKLRKKWGGLLHPDTSAAAFYDVFQVAMLLYLLFTLPYNLAFDLVAQPHQTLFWVDVGVDLALGFDMFLNFFRYHTHTRTRELITDPKVIRNKYLKGWFLIDVVAIFPFDWAIRVWASLQVCEGVECTDAHNEARSARLVRLTKMSRMARITKLAKISHLRAMTKTMVQFGKNLGVTQLGFEFWLRVTGLVLLLVACAHLIACLWLYVGISSVAEQDSEGKNWMLAEYGSLSNAVAVGERRYIDATYWVFVTVSSVGFGDILPFSTSEREFACAAIVAGTFLYAYIIGTFTNMISNMGQDKSTFDAKMRSISELMKFLNVPAALEYKVHSYYEYKFANNTMFTEGIADELPSRLRADLILHRYQAVIDKVPFFHGCREDAIVDICGQLKSHAIMPDDDIIIRGEPYRELVIITAGKARSIPQGDPESPKAASAASPRIVKDLDAVIEFVEGSFFGELEFLGFSTARSMTVRAMRFTEVSTLSPSDIGPVLDVHIGLQRRLHRYGRLKKDLDRMAQDHSGPVDELELELMKERIESQFHDTEENELRGIWDDVDKDETGTLTLEEFKIGLENLGIQLNRGNLQDSFGSLDKGETGEIHFEDFLAWWGKNENRLRASTHDQNVNESVRDTQRRVATVEEAVEGLQSDMAVLLSILRDK